MHIFKTQWRRRTYTDRIVIAAVFSLAAPFFTLLFHRYLNDSQMLFYIFATALSAWWGGFTSGSITAVLSLLFYNLIPENTLGQLFTEGDRFLEALLFLAFSIVLSYLESFRQRYETLLEDTRAELETILNGVDDGISAQRPDGSYTYVNECAADILDFESAAILMSISPGELMARNHFSDETGHPVKFSELPPQQALKQGLPFASDLRLNFEQSEVERWVRIKSTPILDESGKPRLVISVLRDITQRKYFEEEMISLMAIVDQERERLWTIMGNVPGIIWENTSSPDTREANISFVSEYAEKLLGYSIQSWKESENFWIQIIPADVLPSVIQETMQLAEQQDSGTLQFPVMAEDGRLLEMDAFLSFMRDAEGRVSGVRGVMMDVTERRQSERLLEQTTEELRRSNAELQQFAYIASHDLQEPLRMIASYLQLIERRYHDLLDDDGREFIHYAVDGAARMKTLINDLLAYSRVQTQQQKFTVLPVESALQAALQNLKVVIEEKDVKIEYDKLPQVYGDQSLIAQLLQNLLSNAIKFKRLDTVHITLRFQQAKQNWWEFALSDNGIGIDQHYFDRIFAIFQRLHTHEHYSGTGIGLSICKKVIERHGGHIWLESTVGVGTTFYFTLPATASAFDTEKSRYVIHDAVIEQ